MGRGGGLVVSVLAFYSDDPSSNPADSLNILFEKTKINEKEAGFDPSLKNSVSEESRQLEEGSESSNK